MISRSSIMRLILVVTIVFLVKIEGTTHQPTSSHYSGRRILSSSDKKNNENYNNYLHLMQSNFYSASEGNRRLDPYYTDNDLELESNSNNHEQIYLNSEWNDSQHHTVAKHIKNYKDTTNNNYADDEDVNSSNQHNSLYYEPSFSPAVQESSWPYSTYYTDTEKTTSTPASGSIAGYYESSSPTSFPLYNAPTYGQPTEAPSINPIETEVVAVEENSIDTETVFGKIRKKIKDVASNFGLCAGSWVGCVICVTTFGGFPQLGPLPYSCITSCSLGIFTNCARFDLFSHFEG